MKITLTRTGGFIPITKKATTEVNWSANDIDAIVASAGIFPGNEPQLRDGFYYTLETGDRQFAINPDKVPPAYQTVINGLIKNLVIIK
jgi:hypothetical protein